MEALLNNIVQATGWSILHSLWQGALIYALLMPSQMKMFHLSAKIKYTFAYTANLLLFISFTITFFTLFKWPADQQQAAINANMAYHPAILSDSAAAILTHYAEKLFPYLVLFYSAGLLVQSFIVIKGYNKVQQLKKAARIAIPEEWNTLFNSLIGKMNISIPVTFHLSAHVNVPLVIGFLKPVVLFPVALAAQMEMKQVEAILIHELSHIRRNDYMFNLIRTMIETILFFNPFVWLTGKFIDIEREHACDDLVVKLTHTPLTYAHALLQLELLADQSSPVFALAATGKNQHLYQRIKRITDMKTSYMNSKQKLFAVTLTLATIVSLAWINPAKSEKTRKNLNVLPLVSVAAPAIQLPIDTGKKKTKKVIIKNVDAPAVMMIRLDTTVANPEVSVKSISIDPKVTTNLETDSVLSPELSTSISNFTVNIKDMVLSGLNGDQAKLAKLSAEMEKRGNEMQKKFDSPQQKAKWEKMAAEMKAKYDNPKERARLEKLGKEMQLKFNSPAQMEKMKKLQVLAKVQAEKAQKMMISPEFRQAMQIRFDYALNANDDQQKIKQTPEYQQLKKKFDEDVEKLKAKELQKNNN
ncbi:M56 family metallopeptidase [Pedobacter cryoconitis]|uniref:Beta-lactamase regulating signal transducer with metallopeptidase domain n=1 Tax=Pedobacter cryoconitis TaxID=188932 RepID=A0A7X0J4A6_9SPHI|nr:M56 family metallopeptidase [Pedobacter cryoconitis]MBB6500603.1 beta-lactamase regulating signal transducer with metallopeptidase domain [Pedobacter cryoconitis]